ncbi:hypothetical protein P175DRAFT_0479848 [Aspergillus ochraceoroseus IBT 24754]|uniref:Spindle pole body component n=2 Tax=Aspergillus ochraceoroseus TaxID=138278 RepID=A0A2T5LXV6_9EURO|nr:uncharacterized protein P175DRAFT_0479848 [Aspergillus ochraceoroseus IBT 24754]PTU21121.1 hypothetical protein P175DRAFT_0479848 [Aspergillus ochraceoroseus IBT 24754]
MSSVNTVMDDLITLVAKTDKDTPRFRNLKRRADDTLRSPLYARTDQFAVAKQLAGLQEKFQVLSKDDLADALRVRLTELDEHRSPWFPEILSLLLQLADRPAQLSRVDRIEKLKPDEDATVLSWTNLDVSGSAFCDEDIWESVDFGAGSSEDDDISSISSHSQLPRSFSQVPLVNGDDYVIPDDIFSSGEDDELVASIEGVQFWREESMSDISKHEKASSRLVTELQAIREAIFMLQGLPTSLFWRLDGNVEVDRRYTLSHLSYGSLSSLMRTLSSYGTKIDLLREFAKSPQTVSYLQTFHRSIEDSLCKFDLFLSNMQSRYLSPRTTVAISLLQLSEDVYRESKLLLLLSDLVSDLRRSADNSPIRCLELIYNMVCMTQAAGDDDSFTILAHTFFSCFDTYARPIRDWMEKGQLEGSTGAFFIHENRETNDLRNLWHNRYRLEKQSESASLPKFIEPFAEKIFVTGKSMVFLRHLNMIEECEWQEARKSSLKFEDTHPSTSSPSIYLPFDALLEAAISKMVNDCHKFASSRLRTGLDEQCGLWTSLEALEHIYLCKDMSVIAPIDAKIFELIDRGKGGWSDRFLLTEVAQSAFGTMNFIDPSRLIVRSSRDAHNKPHSRSRSVKILNTLSFDYVLPWPVANIITKHGVTSYQRLATFLMQIRRAKYLIVKQVLERNHESDAPSRSKGSGTLSHALRHHMLWFLNVLYSHLTDFVISSTTESLRKALSTATDVDSMIAAHHSYMASLEEQCLLSENLRPLHQATITLLDLCTSFADMQVTRYKQYHADLRKTPRRQSKALSTGMTPRKTRYEYSYGDEDASDKEDDESEEGEKEENDDDDDDDDDEVHSSSHRQTPFHEFQFIQRLRDIQDQFNRLITFMAAGLKAVGRIDGQISWEMLAEKLEWRKEGRLLPA